MKTLIKNIVLTSALVGILSCSKSLEEISKEIGGGWNPSISADGKHVALQEKNQIWVHDLETQSSKQITSSGYNDTPSISGDGRLIVYGSDNKLFLHDVQKNKTEQILKELPAEIYDPSISANGKHISFSFKNDIFVYDLDTDSIEQITTYEGKDRESSLSADGNLVAFSSTRFRTYDIFVYNRKTKELKEVAGKWSFDLSPSISADGKYVAFESDRAIDPKTFLYGLWNKDLDVYVYNLDTDSLRRITSNKVIDGRPSISGDGSLIVYESDDPQKSRIFLEQLIQPNKK